MKLHQLIRKQKLKIDINTAWGFFSDPHNLNSITPDILNFRMMAPIESKMYEGQIIEYRVKIAPFVHWIWVTELKSIREKQSFVDEQRIGPYRFWHHQHHFEEIEDGIMMTDIVHYSVPFWPFGELVHELYVKNRLKLIFDYRYQVLEEHFNQGKNLFDI